MKGKIFLVTTIILLIGLGVAGYLIFDYSAQIEGLREEVEDISEDKELYMNGYYVKSREYESIESKLSYLEEYRMCDGKDIDIPYALYGSIETITEYLETWYEDRFAVRITDVSTHTIWESYKTSLIDIKSEGPYGDSYRSVFIVYFEEDIGFNAVFVVAGSCWLDFEIY